MSQEKQQVKVFDRTVFEKVKKMQGFKKPKTREEIMAATGFGKETIRKAMKAPNWPQYRKNERSAQRARIDKRELNKILDPEKKVDGYTAGGHDLLLDPKDGTMTPTAGQHVPDNTRRNMGIAGAVLLIALVLFLMSR